MELVLVKENFSQKIQKQFPKELPASKALLVDG